MPGIDIYSTHAQLAALELIPHEPQALLDLFVHDCGVTEDDEVIYDFMKGSQQMAPVVRKGTGGVLMGRDGYETKKVGFATVAPERVVDVPVISERMFGERVFGAMTPAQRSKKLQAKDLVDMRRAIDRRKVYMAREVLFTGRLTLVEYTNAGRSATPRLVADYGFTQNYSPDTVWGGVGAKVADDMKNMYEMVYDGLGVPEIMLMASDVGSAMLADEAYMKTMDYKHADLGEIKTRYTGQGLRFIGRNAEGVEMYSSSLKIVGEDGTMIPLVPNGKAILGSRGMLNMYFGPVTQVEDPTKTEHTTYFKKEVPLRYADINDNAIKNRLTSCPTFVPKNVDGWVVANLL